MQRQRLKTVYFYGHGTKGVHLAIISRASSTRPSLSNYNLKNDLFLWHKTRTNLNYFHQTIYAVISGPKKPTNLTSLKNSCRVLKLTLPPKPLRRPTMNWPLSVTALRCDRPLNIVPTTLVSTTKSFLKKNKQKKNKAKFDF